jgi:hypothetical protein
MKKQTRQAVLSSAVLAMALLGVIGFVEASNNSSIDLTNFNPVQVSSVAFTVLDQNYNKLGFVNTTAGSTKVWTDASGKYPDIESFTSAHVFPCDISGGYVDPAKWSLEQITQVDMGNGKTITIVHGYLGLSIAARTYARIPAFNQVNELLSPYVGTTVTAHGGYTKYYGSVMAGTLTFIQDTGVSGWADSNSQNGLTRGAPCAITTSLLPVQFTTINSQPGVYSQYQTLGNVLNTLATTCGNSPVIVQPQITLTALSRYITATVAESTKDVTLANGSQATITTKLESASVGFLDATHATAQDKKSLVDNLATGSIVPTDMPVISDKNAYDPASNGANVQDKGGYATVTLTGGVSITGTYDTTTSGGAEVHANMGSSVQVQKVDLAQPNTNYGMPTKITVQPEFKLTPKTVVKCATAKVWWQSDLFSGNWWDAYDNVQYQGSGTISWPYSMKVTNIDAEATAVFEVAVALVDQATVHVKATGAPIDLHTVTDFSLNQAIGGNVNTDQVKQTMTHENIYWLEVLANWFANFWNILILVGIGIAVVLFFVYVYPLIKKVVKVFRRR